MHNGNQLKRTLQALKLTQTDLANKCGRHKSGISRMMRRAKFTASDIECLQIAGIDWQSNVKPRQDRIAKHRAIIAKIALLKKGQKTTFEVDESIYSIKRII